MQNEKNEIRQQIHDTLLSMKQANENARTSLGDRVFLTDYAYLTKNTEIGTVWTAALQTALNEHTAVIIPASDEVYYIDDTVIVPPHRTISAYDATIRLTPDCDVLMLRNKNAVDGTHSPVDRSHPDKTFPSAADGGRNPAQHGLVTAAQDALHTESPMPMTVPVRSTVFPRCSISAMSEG